MQAHSAGFVGSVGLALVALLGAGCDSAGTGEGEGGSGASASDTGSPSASGTQASGTQATGNTASSGTGGAPDFTGTVRVDGGMGNATPGGTDVAIAPDGTLYVSWVDAGSTDVFVARSTDGGAHFEAPVRVDDESEVPLVSMARHPYVTATDDRVAVVFNDTPGTIFLHTASSADFTFAPAIVVGSDIQTPFRDFPKAVFFDDGKLEVAWHGYAETGPRIYFSRETTGFVSEEASGGAPGVPCECCPLDVLVSSAGEAMIAFRNNDANTREMWLARSPSSDAFTAWTPISTSEGFVDSCPMQGPRLARTGDDELAAVWSVRGSTNTGEVFFSTSTDGGASWSGGAQIAGFVADEPTLAVGANGHLYVTGVTGTGKSSMVSSTDGGATWASPTKLETPDGDLATPQAKASGGVIALAGVSPAGTVWLRRVE